MIQQSKIQDMPNEILEMIGTSLSFQDLNRLALTGKMGKLWANSVFDLFAKQLLFFGETMEERKCALTQLYRAVSPNFIGALHNDIDKIKDRTFTDRMLTVEYDKNSYTPFFLVDCASEMLDQVAGCEEIAKYYIQTAITPGHYKQFKMLNSYFPHSTDSTKITIRQTQSNSVANIISIKLIEALKKSSTLFFKKLYEICKIPNLASDKSLPIKKKLEKYKNKQALILYQEDKEKAKLDHCHCVIAWLLEETGLFNKVDFLNHHNLTGIYGEKEDIQTFITIIYAQQFPNRFPSLTTLRRARGMAD